MMSPDRCSDVSGERVEGEGRRVSPVAMLGMVVAWTRRPLLKVSMRRAEGSEVLMRDELEASYVGQVSLVSVCASRVRSDTWPDATRVLMSGRSSRASGRA